MWPFRGDITSMLQARLLSTYFFPQQTEQNFRPRLLGHLAADKGSLHPRKRFFFRDKSCRPLPVHTGRSGGEFDTCQHEQTVECILSDKVVQRSLGDFGGRSLLPATLTSHRWQNWDAMLHGSWPILRQLFRRRYWHFQTALLEGLVLQPVELLAPSGQVSLAVDDHGGGLGQVQSLREIPVGWDKVAIPAKHNIESKHNEMHVSIIKWVGLI